jgi:hypothetical protein
MKVLKHGWAYYKIKNNMTVICRNCECEYKYNKSDIKTKTTTDFCTLLPLTFEYVNCPECNEMKILTDGIINI